MRDGRQISRRFSVPLSLVLSAFAAYSQSTTSLRGTVSDPSAAVIPQAKVTLQDPATGFKRQILTGADGVYQFLQVAPGTYQLVVEKPGFSTLTRDGVQLLVNTPSTTDLTMVIGKTGDVVNVMSEAPLLNTTDASIGNAFSERQVRQLPLETRNRVETLSPQPGVTPSGEVLGARRDQNNIMLDGADVNNNQNSGLVQQNPSTGVTYQGVNGNNATSNSGFNAVLPIPLDSVMEFRVTVGGEGPNQGRSSGGQVALITKSGSNQFHGSLYEYNRNTLTAANTWFNNRSGVPREPLIRNQFGASAGGKVVRDRLLYFFNYEERTDSSGGAQARLVPSDSLRQGFMKFQLTDGSVQTLTPAEVQKVDPLLRGVNSAALQVLNQYPAGNDVSYGQDGGLNFSGYRFNAPSHRNDRAIVGKIDYHIDSAGKHPLSIRGTLADNTDDQILAQFPGQGPASTLRDNSKGLSAQYTWLIKPNLIN